MVRDAGLYWYHPHVLSAAQVGAGLYGALLVEDPAGEVGVADELTLVLSDIGCDRKGVLESPESGGPDGTLPVEPGGPGGAAYNPLVKHISLERPHRVAAAQRRSRPDQGGTGWSASPRSGAGGVLGSHQP